MLLFGIEFFDYDATIVLILRLRSIYDNI